MYVSQSPAHHIISKAASQEVIEQKTIDQTMTR
jgi:hypothetical protein